MKRIKLFTVVLCLVLIVFPIQAKAETVAKDEVVYAVMDANGMYDQLFVINTFELLRDGEYTDFGAYETVKNLTNITDIDMKDDKVTFSGDKGIFHYEGILKDVALPWQFSVTYYLDGKEIAPVDLAGKDGHLKIELTSKKDKNGDTTFFDHYILQIGASFPMEDTDRLRVEDGMIANAGDDYQIQFTVMPEEEAAFVVEANVTNFTFAGFEMNAVPSFINIDDPDVGDMEGDMNTLQKAIHDINEGVLQLRNGLADFHDGANELYDGSATYKAGMDELSSEVEVASRELNVAFEQFDQVIKEMDGISAEEMEAVIEALQAFPAALKDLRAEIIQISDDFDQAFSALREAVQSIPNQTLTKEQIQALKDSDIDDEVVDILLASYDAGKSVKAAFKEVEKYESQLDDILENMISSLDEMIVLASELSDGLGALTDITDVMDDVSSISDSYKSFRDGINELTGGILALAGAYGEIHDGIGELSSGSKQLEKGALQLYDGTSKLKKGTDALPDKLKEEIDTLMEKYDKSDFDMVSFVSDKNEKIDKVQFVMKTETIEVVKDETIEKAPEKKSIWQRFLDLFAFFKFWD